MSIEHCHLCDEKFKLENDKSVENHNLIHKEELEGIKFSNNMKDVQKTICHICKNSLAVSRMREHTKRLHNVHITEYKLRYNIANDRCYELVERVFHRCAICSHPFPLDSDLIAGHIRKHKITHANYNAKYMVIKKNDPGISHKRKSQVKEPPKTPKIEPTKTALAESTKNRFPSGLQVTVTKVSENQDATDKRKIGEVEIETNQQESKSPNKVPKVDSLVNKQPVEEKPEENPDTKSKVESPKKDVAKPGLSYAEQIGMFLRGKHPEIKDKKSEPDVKKYKDAEIPNENSKVPKEIKAENNQNKGEECKNTLTKEDEYKKALTKEERGKETLTKEDISNKPNVDSLIGILEKQNSDRNHAQKSSKQTLPITPPLLKRGSNPLPQVTSMIQSPSRTLAQIPTLLKKVLPPVTPMTQSWHSPSNTNLYQTLVQDPITPKVPPVNHISTKTQSIVTSPSTYRNTGTGTIRVLSPEAINKKVDNPKTTSIPIQASLPLNILGQNAIKKVKLLNGKVLHLFIKNTKAGDPPTKVVERKVVKKSEPACEKVIPIQQKTVEKNMRKVVDIPEDPLLVDAETPAFQVPDSININPLEDGPAITKGDHEVQGESEPTPNSVETDRPDMETCQIEKEHDNSDKISIITEKNAETEAPNVETPFATDENPSSEPISNPNPLDENKTEPVPVSQLDDSGFSDVAVTDISTLSGSLDSSNNEKADMEIDTDELISRLASKTKQILEVPNTRSPLRDEDESSMDPVDRIEKSKEFSEMMKRISDNLAQFNGNKPALSNSSSVSKLNDSDCMDSSIEPDENEMEKDVNEDELDLVVEDIWSENSL